MNTIIEKLRALIKMQIRREELNFASLGGGGQTMNIGALEWVLKQLETLQEQPVTPSVEDAMKELDKKIAKATKSWKGVDVDKMLAECRGYDEQPLADGLEEEINRLSKNEYFDFTDWKAIARHFAQWGAEHLKK